VRIRLTYEPALTAGWPLFRQSPRGAGVWGDAAFVPSSEDTSAFDYWVVVDDLKAPEQALVPPERVVLVTCEPTPMRLYHPRFLEQFGLIVTTQERIDGPNVLHTQLGLPWHVGVRRRVGQGGGTLTDDVATLGYDELRVIALEKSRELSVVCGGEERTEGQRLRLALIDRLQAHFGSRLDVYGRDSNPVEDKWDAVAPYRFQLVLENSAEPHYFTEKLTDAYLGGCFPLYWGCPNLDDYFERDAYEPIDVHDPDGAIATIERVLGEGVTPVRAAALERARHAVLEHYNLFPALLSVLAHCPAGQPRRVRLKSQAAFRRGPWRRRATFRLRSSLSGLRHRHAATASSLD